MEAIIKNSTYTVGITGMTHEGMGVGRIDRFPIFIEGALEGEIVEVKIIKINKNFAVGKPLKIIEFSPSRATPFCKIYKKCGGCSIQHMEYQGQLDFKRQIVEDNLIRIGKLENIKINETIGMIPNLNYRNKAQYPVGKNNEDIVAGFYIRRSHDIIENNVCGIQQGVSDEIRAIVKNFIKENNISIYNEKKGKGLIRHIVTRVGFRTKEVMVVIVATMESFPKKQELIDILTSKVPMVKSIILNINNKKTNVILGERNITLFGNDRITDYIGDYKFEISPLSFYQVNPVQTEVLYSKALEYANLNNDEIVFDLYCGIGTIALFLSQRAKKVYGVEIVGAAIKDAKRNAELNGVKNVEFIEGKAEEVIPKMYEEGIKADVVVVDPPRKGCDQELLETLVKMEPKKIVYVSCKPSTLARDLKFLSENGFIVEEVQPVDMFPHTEHVEAIILMTYCGLEGEK